MSTTPRQAPPLFSPAPAPRGRNLTALSVLALGAICAIALALQIYHFWPFMSDDAYISLRYSQRLLEGHGLTWNDLAPAVEGYTNLLWVLICAGLVYTSNAADYMLTGYLPTYLKVLVHISPTVALAMITATLTILAILLVFVAALSDRIGVKPIMRTGCVLLIVASIPAFLLIRHGSSIALIFVGVLLIGLMELCFDSTSPATMPALFPTNVRNGALAISYNVAISAFGGTTPLIAQALVSGTGDLMVPAYMLIVAGLVGAVTLYFTPEVAGRPLPGSPPTVETEREARTLVQDCD